MKAYFCTRYGPPEVLELREVDEPQYGDNDVLIRIVTTTVTAGDWRIRSRNVPRGFGIIVRLLFGFNAPRQPVLGSELCGQVVAVGDNVDEFEVGDAVIGYNDMKSGAHAEFIAMAKDAPLVPKPASVNYETAAAVGFGGCTALHFLREANLQVGERLLVNGASGAVGSAAVQLGKYMGAHVTGVCSTSNVELVRSIGADDVIDYKSEEVARTGRQFDVIVDTAGTLPFDKAKNILSETGRLSVVNGSLVDLIRSPLSKLTSGHTMISGVATGSREDMQLLVGLMEEGRYTPVIDSQYPFAEMVEAHRRVDSGRKRGNVIVNVNTPLANPMSSSYEQAT